jgi:hypothetical protein
MRVWNMPKLNTASKDYHPQFVFLWREKLRHLTYYSSRSNLKTFAGTAVFNRAIIGLSQPYNLIYAVEHKFLIDRYQSLLGCEMIMNTIDFLKKSDVLAEEGPFKLLEYLVCLTHLYCDLNFIRSLLDILC